MPTTSAAPLRGLTEGPRTPGLHTELYQIMQVAAYHADGLWGEATFDLVLRGGPDGQDRALIVGIEEAVRAILDLGFSEEEVRWLEGHAALQQLPGAFFQLLRKLRFTGEVLAVPDGTVISAGAPILRVTAPLSQAGLLETRVHAAVALSSAVATRAAAIVQAAAGRPVVDFGARRCPDAESSVAASRAARVAGFAGTTNALAAQRLGIPPWAVGSEAMLAVWGDAEAASMACKQVFGDRLLLDLPAGPVDEAVARLAPLGRALTCVRVDRPQLAAILPGLRRALDRHGLPFVRVMASGGLGADEVRALRESNASVDVFAVGGALFDGSPPRLAYKVVELVRGTEPTPAPTGPGAWPGRKQLLRRRDHDLLCLEVETLGGRAEGQPLLESFVRRGERVRSAEAVDLSAERARAGAERLLRSAPWPVRVSPALEALASRSSAER